MAHEIETCFTVGEAPWHGLGHVMQDPPTTIEDVLAHAGLVWDVGVVPTFLANGKPAGHACMRSDTGDAIATCGEGYHPLQARDMVAPLQRLVDAGLATWESGGSLRGGARQWAQVRLQGLQADIVPGDTISAFALATNAHDGTMSARAGDVATRVVCQNTLSRALAEGGTKGARHSKGVLPAWDDIGAAMEARVHSFARQVEAYQSLTTKTITDELFRAYVTDVFKPETEASQVALMERVQPLFEAGRGTEIAGVRGTMWGAVNAISEYVQHERKGSGAQRLDALMFGGTSSAINARAMTLAMAA